MRDTDIFGVLLGLTPEWTVSSVELDTQAVRLKVECVGPYRCPECGVVGTIHDHSAERTWRHLDTMQFMTLVSCRVPRVDCQTHGVKQLGVPWAGPKSRFTEMFEALVIRVLELTRCQYRTASLLRLSSGQVHDVMHRAVNRGLARRELAEIAHLSVDEKSFQKGHDFATILCDSTAKRVIEVARGRNEEAALTALKCLPQAGKVKTITADMSEAYKNAAKNGLPQADLIHDRFHVAMMLGEAVDDTRRAEVKKYRELVDTRYVWLKNPENLTEKQTAAFNALIGAELKTAKAYGFKQAFRAFFEQDDLASAETFFLEWTAELERHDLPKVDKVARTLAKNLAGLLNYVRLKLTNGFAEAVNALIQEIKTIARGFRRFENFRIAILFFLGKLDLYPRKTP